MFHSLLRLFLTQDCIKEFFVDYNFFHVACLKAALSKLLGYGVILGATIVKVPQILKIFKASSARGISIYSLLLELLAVTATATYAIAQKFPFSAYGEAVFLVLQTACLVCQVYYYSRGIESSLVFLMTYIITLGFLLSPAVPQALLYGLQAGNIPIVIISKSIQALDNYRNGSTGELSSITVFLLFIGSVARIFTSIQETGDMLIVLMYIASTTCNGILAAQIVYYWNVTHRTKRD